MITQFAQDLTLRPGLPHSSTAAIVREHDVDTPALGDTSISFPPERVRDRIDALS